jgi:hypothetical protein
MPLGNQGPLRSERLLDAIKVALTRSRGPNHDREVFDLSCLILPALTE